MSDLTIFFISLAGVLFIGILFKVSLVLGKRKANTLSPRYDGKNKNVSLGTGNGCGFAMSGTLFFNFREHDLSKAPFYSYGETKVAYRFFTFLFIPIIPLGCYRIGSYSSMVRHNRKRYSEAYTIYGTEKWLFWEVVSIYCVPCLIISVIQLISSICYLF